jgi:hypothetical protein
VFDVQKEFIEYCDSDVDIRGRGCLELRKKFLEIADIDSFQYITIAGVCMAIYRSATKNYGGHKRHRKRNVQ